MRTTASHFRPLLTPVREPAPLGTVQVDDDVVHSTNYLLGEHARARLAQHHRLIRAGVGRGELGVELVGLGPALGHHLGELGAERPRRRGGGPGLPLRAGRSRTLSSAVCPGATVSVYQKAHLVPTRSGLTVGASWTTWSLMPSLG